MSGIVWLPRAHLVRANIIVIIILLVIVFIFNHLLRVVIFLLIISNDHARGEGLFFIILLDGVESVLYSSLFLSHDILGIRVVLILGGSWISTWGLKEVERLLGFKLNAQTA
jgi:hypothetical protein